jgi:hypothetical protein
MSSEYNASRRDRGVVLCLHRLSLAATSGKNAFGNPPSTVTMERTHRPISVYPERCTGQIEAGHAAY